MTDFRLQETSRILTEYRDRIRVLERETVKLRGKLSEQVRLRKQTAMELRQALCKKPKEEA